MFDGGVCDHAPHRLLADWIIFHQTEAELSIWLEMLLDKNSLQQQHETEQTYDSLPVAGTSGKADGEALC